MTRKIFRGIMLVSVVSCLVCLGVTLSILYRIYGDTLNRELRLDAYLAEAGVEAGGEAYLESLVKPDVRITWIADDGTVLFDNQADPSAMGNHAGREEVTEAMSDGEGYSIRYSDTLSYKIAYYALRLDDGTVLRMADQRSSIWKLFGSMAWPIGLMLIMVAGLSVLLSTMLAKKIVQPINEIDPDHPKADGTYKELAPLLDKLERQSRDINTQIELLDRRRNEFRLITENMNEGFVIVDTRGEVLSYNASALRRLGGGRTGGLMLDDSFRQAVDVAMGGSHNEQRCDEKGKVYSIIADPVYEKNVLYGAVVIILDITEKEQREQLRREFTSNVSHELKTPLTSIYGISELLMNGIVKSEDVPGFGENIHTETGRLITLIEDIINLSQLDENSVPQDKAPVDLYEVAAQVVSRLESAAAAKSVVMTLTGGSAIVTGIRGILEEMIYNLADNAIKYNIECGRVKLFVGYEDEHPVVTVQDTGIGIPKSHQERVFERFYRVDKSHSRKIGGTGLGLSIVKHGAAYHNASIRLESEEGMGSKFTIKF